MKIEPLEIEALTLKMFESSYREQFENFKSRMSYFEFLRQSQKIYNDFTDELFELSYDSLVNKDKIIHFIQNHINPQNLYLWIMVKGLEENNSEFKNLDSLDNDYIFNEIIKPNIQCVASELARDTAQIANFLSDEIFTYSQIYQSNLSSQNQDSDKITLNGNIQLWEFIFNELINKGYITAPKHNGKVSHAKFARQLLQHFEFTSQNNEKQPSENYLTKALKENKYSNSKQEIFKIPNIKIAND